MESLARWSLPAGEQASLPDDFPSTAPTFIFLDDTTSTGFIFSWELPRPRQPSKHHTIKDTKQLTPYALCKESPIHRITQRKSTAPSPTRSKPRSTTTQTRRH